MTKIKFCGLFCVPDIEAANTLLPDYAGFVFVPQSRRYVTQKTVTAKSNHAGFQKIQTVGVFADEKPEIMAQLANQQILIHMIQLHGQETSQTIETLRRLTSAPENPCRHLSYTQPPICTEPKPAALT